MDQRVLSLSQALPGRVFPRESQGYVESLSTYFSAQESQIKPACIVRPQTTADVVNTISHLVQANKLHGIGSLKFAIHSGGHACFAGSANVSDGVTIDLRGLNSIDVNEGASEVSIGTGASWEKSTAGWILWVWQYLGADIRKSESADSHWEVRPLFPFALLSAPSNRRDIVGCETRARYHRLEEHLNLA